jgi:hypothetical protein
MSKTYGADVAQPVSERGWRLLTTQHAVKFAIIRCYRNDAEGVPDEDCPATVANALASGIADVDVYHFPVVNSKTPEQQAQESLAFLKENDVGFNRFWLDVETGAWNESDVSLNVDFIQRLVTAVGAADVVIGIYCSTSGWEKITGNTTQFSELPLWWSSHGAEFTAFGGWTAPAVVQFRYNQLADGIGFDGDYRVD